VFCDEDSKSLSFEKIEGRGLCSILASPVISVLAVGLLELLTFNNHPATGVFLTTTSPSLGNDLRAPDFCP
jgi:hypothetical protein